MRRRPRRRRASDSRSDPFNHSSPKSYLHISPTITICYSFTGLSFNQLIIYLLATIFLFHSRISHLLYLISLFDQKKINSLKNCLFPKVSNSPEASSFTGVFALLPPNSVTPNALYCQSVPQGVEANDVLQMLLLFLPVHLSPASWPSKVSLFSHHSAAYICAAIGRMYWPALTGPKQRRPLKTVLGHGRK